MKNTFAKLRYLHEKSKRNYCLLFEFNINYVIYLFIFHTQGNSIGTAYQCVVLPTLPNVHT
jgi:hypothetical protein